MTGFNLVIVPKNTINGSLPRLPKNEKRYVNGKQS